MIKVVGPNDRKLGEAPYVPSDYQFGDWVESQKDKIHIQIVHGIPTDFFAPVLPGSMDDLGIELVEYAPGAKNAMHSHSEAQFGVIISGQMRVTSIDGDAWDMDPGTVFYMDANDEYSFEALTDQPCLFVEGRQRSAAFYPHGTNPRITSK